MNRGSETCQFMSSVSVYKMLKKSGTVGETVSYGRTMDHKGNILLVTSAAVYITSKSFKCRTRIPFREITAVYLSSHDHDLLIMLKDSSVKTIEMSETVKDLVESLEAQYFRLTRRKLEIYEFSKAIPALN